jgi:hypothetical protein
MRNLAAVTFLIVLAIAANPFRSGLSGTFAFSCGGVCTPTVDPVAEQTSSPPWFVRVQLGHLTASIGKDAAEEVVIPMKELVVSLQSIIGGLTSAAVYGIVIWHLLPTLLAS